MVPENLRLQLRTLLEDLRLFQGKEPPPELFLELMALAGQLGEDEPLSKPLMVFALAVLPQQPGEDPLPAGMDRFVDWMSQDLIHKLGGLCPIPPSQPPTNTSL